MRSWSGRGALPVVAACALAAAGTGVPKSPLGLRVDPVPLSLVDPAVLSVGSLRYRGGLALRSDAPGFGGLSDLRLLDHGSRFVAISDCGSSLSGTLRYGPQGDLIDVVDAELVPLAGPGGRPLAFGEEDAESLAIAPDGSYVVGFEGRHRLWRYPAETEPLHGAPVPIEGPPIEGWFRPNQGFEAALFLDDGRLLLMGEASARGSRNAPGWIGAPGSWESILLPFHYGAEAPDQPFRPTALAALPNGDLLVLERRYPLVAARVRRIPRGALERRSGLEGVEVATLEPPLSVDNFEGLDVVRLPDGQLRLFLISDDNDCEKWGHRHGTSIQRTLLLSFSIEP